MIVVSNAGPLIALARIERLVVRSTVTSCKRVARDRKTEERVVLITQSALESAAPFTYVTQHVYRTK